jgi:hypothetical protein
MDYQDLRRLVNAQLLVSLLMLLAFCTIPLISCFELFNLSEVLEALIYGHNSFIGRLLFGFVHDFVKIFQTFVVKVFAQGTWLESHFNLILSKGKLRDKLGDV